MPRQTEGFEAIAIERIDNTLFAILRGKPGSTPQRKAQCSSVQAEKQREFVIRWQRVAVESYLDFEIPQDLAIPGFYPA